MVLEPILILIMIFQCCVECIESGKMTKDLAICIHGLEKTKEGMFLNTEDFLQAIADQLDRKLAK